MHAARLRLRAGSSTRTSSSSATRRVVSSSTCAIATTWRKARSCAVAAGSFHCVSIFVVAQASRPDRVTSSRAVSRGHQRGTRRQYASYSAP